MSRSVKNLNRLIIDNCETIFHTVNYSKIHHDHSNLYVGVNTKKLAKIFKEVLGEHKPSR